MPEEYQSFPEMSIGKSDPMACCNGTGNLKITKIKIIGTEWRSSRAI